MEPERTSDGRWLIIGGRRWRASDPAIPGPLRTELVGELMRGRRLVRTRGDEARPFVDDAKVALGERGEPWWEPATDSGLRDRLAAVMRALLRARDGPSICPSDAARVAGGGDWRRVVPVAREVADTLAAQGVVVVQQKGKTLTAVTAKGPIRIAPGPGLNR